MFWILWLISLIVSGFGFKFEMVGYTLPSDWTEDEKWGLELLVSFIPILNLLSALAVIAEGLLEGVGERGM